MVEVKDAGEDLKREARGQTVHPFINPGVVAILLIRLRFRIGILQALTVIDAHFRVDAGVFRLFQARQDGEARQRFQRARRARRMHQLTVVKQFLVNFDLFGDPQAVRHLDDVHAVKEGLVVFVVTEGHPFRFVRVGKNDPVKRQGGDTFRPVVVSFLSGRQQRMQHLDGRFKHLDEFHNPLVSPAQRAGVTVGIRVVLREVFQLADVDLTDQRRNILVVLITGFRFGDGDLFQDRRPDFHHAEFGDVATKFVQAFGRPRGHDGA